MKTPWSDLIKDYGTAFATFVVMVGATLIFLCVLAVAVLLSKFAAYIK